MRARTAVCLMIVAFAGALAARAGAAESALDEVERRGRERDVERRLREGERDLDRRREVAERRIRNLREHMEEARREATERGRERDRPPEAIRPHVFRFEHIPAESFLDTLRRLGEHEEVGARLKRIPLALNEPANAVVVIGPPEVIEFLSIIAEGLDEPPEFHERMRHLEREDRTRRWKERTDMGRHGPPPRCPRCPMMAPQGGPGRGPRPKDGPPCMMGPRMGPGRGSGPERPARPHPRKPEPEKPRRGRHRPGDGPAPEATPAQPASFLLIQDGPEPAPAAEGEEEGRRPRREFGRGQPLALMLLRDENVRADLRLTPDQDLILADLLAQAEETVSLAAARAMAARTADPEEGALPPEEMTEEQRQEAARARWQAMREVWQDVRGQLSDLNQATVDTLTEDQRGKLDAVAQSRRESRQGGPRGWRGPGGAWSLTRDEVAKELGLDQTQVADIRAILDQTRADVMEMARGTMQAVADLPADTPMQERARLLREAYRDVTAQREEMMAAAQERAMQVLTPEQRQAARVYVEPSGPTRGNTVTRTIRPKPETKEEAPAPVEYGT